MKRLAMAAVFTSMIGMGLAGPAPARAEEIRALGGPRSDAPNEVAIRKRYDEFQSAWNRHDPSAMAAMWAIDGDHQEPDGREARGRGDVEKLFGMEHATVFKDTTLALSISTVWFIQADVALIDGKYRLGGAVDTKGKALPPLTGHLTAILMKENDAWWIAASRLMRPVPLEWRASESE